MTPARPGSVMWRNLPQLPAPSIAAASYSSAGIACSPASRVTAKNGNPCQITARTTPAIAVLDCASQGTDCDRMPSRTPMLFSTPRLKSSIQVQISPMITDGSAHGTTTSARAMPRHAKLRFSSRAAVKPRANCSETAQTTQTSELPRLSQNTGSASARA